MAREKKRMLNQMYILNRKTVNEILEGNEPEIMHLVKETYMLFAQGRCSLPQSVFLRFPDREARIIGLPSYVGGEAPYAGIKWIASFPGNLKSGLERASAVILLNDMETGLVHTILEGTDISAKRTAAGAVCAALALHKGEPDHLGLVGCGRIHHEMLTFFSSACPVKKLYLYDINEERAGKFYEQYCTDYDIQMVRDYNDLFDRARLISFATTASAPYLKAPESLTPDHTILGISLRDCSVGMVNRCTNVVDSIEHVNREKTSIHITALFNGNTDFIESEIGDIFCKGSYQRNPDKPVLYSPFGLGILDTALAQYVRNKVIAEGRISPVADFY